MGQSSRLYFTENGIRLESKYGVSEGSEEVLAIKVIPGLK